MDLVQRVAGGCLERAAHFINRPIPASRAMAVLHLLGALFFGGVGFGLLGALYLVDRARRRSQPKD